MKLLLFITLYFGCTSTNDKIDSFSKDTGEFILRGDLQLSMPVLETELISTPVMGVDHDPEQYEGIMRAICTSYSGESFPYCYDEHDGSDFLLDGSFETMDAGSATIIAALDGVVVSVEDGHYDRCHADLASGDVSCDGYEMIGNHVILEHEGGFRTLYWHMKSGSVAVKINQVIKTGDPLGLIGSSGYSSAPHLHFELQDQEKNAIDPFAGEFSQEETWWCDQGTSETLPGTCN